MVCDESCNGPDCKSTSPGVDVSSTLGSDVSRSSTFGVVTAWLCAEKDGWLFFDDPGCERRIRIHSNVTDSLRRTAAIGILIGEVFLVEPSNDGWFNVKCVVNSGCWSNWGSAFTSEKIQSANTSLSTSLLDVSLRDGYVMRVLGNVIRSFISICIPYNELMRRETHSMTQAMTLAQAMGSARSALRTVVK